MSFNRPSPTRKTLHFPRAELLTLIEQRFPGYRAIIKLIEIALDDDTPKDLKVTCHKEVAKYTDAQLKAIDLTHLDRDGQTYKAVNQEELVELIRAMKNTF